jgi:hypothetical protein
VALISANRDDEGFFAFVICFEFENNVRACLLPAHCLCHACLAAPGSCAYEPWEIKENGTREIEKGIANGNGLIVLHKKRNVDKTSGTTSDRRKTAHDRKIMTGCVNS